ncbi:MAG: adenylate/guanylate cyclase domain-containing protein, partial [Acidimicrobiia bacterium]|nr:adenylate/guanylate cyclase domain-containing protein [Acidimicrobiia bacterium]
FVVSLASLLVAAVVGVQSGRNLGDDIDDEQLVALRSSGVIDVEIMLNALERTGDALAASPQAVAAVDQFADAHATLAETPLNELEDEVEDLVELYQERYIEPLRDFGIDIDVRDIAAQNTAGLYLQDVYVVGGLSALEEPSAVDDAGDGSEWSAVHAQVHPVYRDVVERAELVDLFLVEPDDLNVVYSVNKRPGLGTSLRVGPFSGSLIANTVDEVLADPDRGTVISDLTYYPPTLGVPVGAAATPIRDGNRLAGVLVQVYDGRLLTSTLTADGEWDEAGFPDGAETFVIGGDGLMRSEPRAFIEAPSAYLDAATEAGTLTDDERAAAEALGSTVLIQQATDSTVNAAEADDSSIETRQTLVGTSALSTVEPLPSDQLDWYVVSEINQSVAEGDLDDFQELLIVGTAIFAVALAFIVVAWANSIIRPVRQISELLSGVQRDAPPVQVPPRSPIEFHRLASSFNSMRQSLDEQHHQLLDARQHRLEVLRRMLPPAVADRVAAGEVESLDQVPQASVVVVVVSGLSVLGRDHDGSTDRATIEALLAELDDLAAVHGLERIKVVGDAYFASCGHDRPYIDHAPRTLAFVADAQGAVREAGARAGVGLDVAAGVHTGPVTVGLAGGERMVYDVWGPTVSVAHRLARRATRGQTLLSDDTAAVLPDDIDRAQIDTVDKLRIWATGAPVSGRSS